ncbi:MAG: hypothetical protein M5R36_00250 [Deltaproteobacteria bacterium]|nr:hypothetical protein [Deltaproteobacteria bacterium]
MRVLGLCDGHEAGACLAVDGRVIFAASEERYTGRKRQPGFPGRAVHACLEWSGIAPQDIHAVAVAEKSGRAVHRLLHPIYRHTDPNQPMLRPMNLLSASIQNTIAGQPALSRWDSAVAHKTMRRKLRRGGIAAPLHFVDHHRAHAISAAFAAPFSESLVVTMDAFGDGVSATVSTWSAGMLEEIDRTPVPHSAAILYGRTTAYLGFSEGDEGKVAAMAARGDASATVSIFNDWLVFGDGKLTLRVVPTHARLRAAFADFSASDVAAGLQACVEDHVGACVKYWMRRTGMKKPRAGRRVVRQRPVE